MSTSTARGGRNTRLGFRAVRSTGIEVGDASLRVAEITRGRSRDVWRLATVQLPDPSDESGSRALSRSIKKEGFARAPAICALSSPLVDVFPLSFDPEQVHDLDRLVIEQAQDRLSYALSDAVLDYVPIPEWARRPGDWATGVLVYAVPRHHVEEVLDGLGAAGLGVERVLTPGAALAPRLSPRAKDESMRQLVIAIGEEVTSISVVERRHVLLERLLPWGADRMTENAARSLELSVSDARSLLERSAAPRPGTEPEAIDDADPEKRLHRVIGDILGTELDELSREANGCVGYCSSFLRQRTIERLVLVGPFADSPPLIAFLRRALELSVVTLDGPAENLGTETRPGDPSFATAASCALWFDGMSVDDPEAS